MTLLELMDAVAASDLHASRRLVLLWMARRAAGRGGVLGEAWPSVADLTASTGLSRRSVMASLKELRALRWLVPVGERGKGVVVYVIHRGATIAPVQPSHQCNHCTPGVQPLHPHRCNHCTRKKQGEEALEEAPPLTPPTPGGLATALMAGGVTPEQARNLLDADLKTLRRGLRHAKLIPGVPKGTTAADLMQACRSILRQGLA